MKTISTHLTTLAKVKVTSVLAVKRVCLECLLMFAFCLGILWYATSKYFNRKD